MSFSSCILKGLLALFVIPVIMFSHLPSVQANDPTKIVLPAVSDRSGYNLPELNTALMNMLRSQFRFPKYETLLTGSLANASSRTALEEITTAKAADGAVVIEINRVRNRSWVFEDETFEETDLTLTLTYFDKKTGQYGQFKATRSATEIPSIHSGPVPLALDAMKEMLNRLDKIFPRQFPGPRY